MKCYIVRLKLHSIKMFAESLAAVNHLIRYAMQPWKNLTLFKEDEEDPKKMLYFQTATRFKFEK